MEQVLSIVVRNQPGVLMRVAGMFSRRGYNIDSLAVGITQNPEFSRMTVTMQANDTTVDQVCKQLAKLVEVEAVKILPPHNTSQRSMALIKVQTSDKRLEILRVADVFRAHAIDISGESLTFLITGDVSKLRAFEEVMKSSGIMEMVQTGTVALERGEETLTVTKSRYKWPERVTGKNNSDQCKLI